MASSRVTVPIHGTTDFRAPLPDDAGKGISSLPGTVLANPNSQRLLGHIPGGQSHELRHGLEIASTEVENRSVQRPHLGSATGVRIGASLRLLCELASASGSFSPPYWRSSGRAFCCGVVGCQQDTAVGFDGWNAVSRLEPEPVRHVLRQCRAD